MRGDAAAFRVAAGRNVAIGEALAILAARIICWR
jgi:hypothetical protein